MPKSALKVLATLLVVAAASAASLSAWAIETDAQAPMYGQSRVAPSGEWIIAPGESPRSLAQLLYPQQPGIQRRFIAALAEANPALGIDASGSQPLEVGTLLQMPDWRAMSGREESPRRESRVTPAGSSTDTAVGREQAPTVRASQANLAQAIPDSRRRAFSDAASMPRLRLSTNLATGTEASDQLRQILRLEYRLLTTLNEQLSALATPPSAELPALPEPQRTTPPLQQAALSAAPPAPLPQATSLAAAASVPATENLLAPILPPAPVKIREVPAPAPVGEASSDATEWGYAIGLGAAVLLLVGLVLRRRRVPVDEPQNFEMAQTVLLEHPLPAESAAIRSSGDKPGEPTPVSRGPAAPPMSAEPEVADANPNPVMELAEIMLSFGRLQGAAQTLQEYIEANPKEALQPWVKLLDIYRTGDMHAEFDALAHKLNKNFNVEVQHWDEQAVPLAETETEEQLPKATTLEELPHICAQLVARWVLPDCLDYLHQLLRDNRGGQRSGFTLPVVQEILLLIDILVDREAA
jgi:hypothetical protein